MEFSIGTNSLTIMSSMVVHMMFRNILLGRAIHHAVQLSAHFHCRGGIQILLHVLKRTMGYLHGTRSQIIGITSMLLK